MRQTFQYRTINLGLEACKLVLPILIIHRLEQFKKTHVNVQVKSPHFIHVTSLSQKRSQQNTVVPLSRFNSDGTFIFLKKTRRMLACT